jgi:hypothetical protein
MEAKRLTLEDIIASEVKRQVGGSVKTGGGLDSFGIKDIGDITKLLQEVGKIMNMQQGAGGRSEHTRTGKDDGSSVNKDSERAVVLLAPPTTKETSGTRQERQPPKFDVPKLVSNVETYMPLLILKFGDLRLSEIPALIETHREELIAGIEDMIKGAMT